MSGVWVFKNGVIRLVENPNQSGSDTQNRRKVMIYLPTGEVVSSYSSLEQILQNLGWERYFGGDTVLLQFHKRSSIDLISLPRDFSKFNSVYMYDIVVKNPSYFHLHGHVSCVDVESCAMIESYLELRKLTSEFGRTQSQTLIVRFLGFIQFSLSQ